MDRGRDLDVDFYILVLQLGASGQFEDLLRSGEQWDASPRNGAMGAACEAGEFPAIMGDGGFLISLSRVLRISLKSSRSHLKRTVEPWVQWYLKVNMRAEAILQLRNILRPLLVICRRCLERVVVHTKQCTAEMDTRVFLLGYRTTMGIVDSRE